MSKRTDQTSYVLTKSALSQALVRYIPKELHKYVKLPFDNFKKAENMGKEELEWMLENSDNMLRMHGSGEDLAADLEIYMGFSSHRWIGYDPIEPLNSFVTNFHSMTEEPFIQKSHVFITLHQFLFFNVGAGKV
ncbi:unnamed protein product [Caenorhabditis nigoni]